jgi:hypothetical protein
VDKSGAVNRHRARVAILAGGSIAGACDITYAIVFSAFRGVAPARILQSVASGLLGAAAYTGGARTAALGLFLHFFIACSWAAIFYAASRRVSALMRHAVISGLLFGVLVYAVMNLLVLPLSAYPRKLTFPPVVLITGLLVHMLLVGLPIALMVRRAHTSAQK